jgi:RND family efflux transporter MFP subunit
MDLERDLGISEGHRRGRLITLAILAGGVALVGILSYVFFFRGSSQQARATEDLKVGRATINANLLISGVADAQLISNLSFQSSGRVDSIQVKVGDTVHKGDVLAALESEDLANSVQSAQANLALAQARLKELLDGATDAERAAADQSVVSAQANQDRAARDVSDLLGTPTSPERTAADQSVAAAQAGLDQAQNSRTTLLNGPTAAQIASANQVVASAQSALNGAQRALDTLRAGPTAAQLAAAHQQLAAADANLASAQAALANLTSGASAAQLAAAQAAVAAAQQGLNGAQTALENAHSNVYSTESALRAARTAYCTAAPGDSLCASVNLPLSSGTVNDLLDKLSNSGTDPSLLAPINTLIQANTGYVVSLNSVDTAQSSVTTAQAQLNSAQAALAALQEGPDATDLAAAQAAVTAAQQNRALAQVNLDTLNAGATADDLANAQDAVRSSQAVLDAAVAQHDHLLAPPTADDVTAADAGVSSAQAALNAAVAKRNDLLGGPHDSTLSSAQDAARSAQGSLDSAIANQTETARGARPSQIDEQTQSVRVAQLAVEAAQIRVRNAEIISPFNGTVAALNLKPGEFTGVGSTTPAIVLLTPDTIVLKMQVGETDYPNVKLDQRGIAVFDALPGKPYPFTVAQLGLSPTVTQGVVTYQVTAAMDIPPGTPLPAPGMSANGQIVTESRPNVISVPPRAIRRKGTDQVVEVRRNSTIEDQVVTTGFSDTTNVEILSGVQEADTIVVPVLISGSASQPNRKPTLPSGIR